VGDNFIEVWQSRLFEFVLGRIRDQLHVRTVPDCVHAFEAFDRRGDGWIDWIKFKKGVRRELKLQVRVSQLFSVWHQMDKSGAGQLTLQIWCELFFPDEEQQIVDLIKTLRAGDTKARMLQSRPATCRLLSTASMAAGAPSETQAPASAGAALGTPSTNNRSDAGLASSLATTSAHASSTVELEKRLDGVERQLTELTGLLRQQVAAQLQSGYRLSKAQADPDEPAQRPAEGANDNQRKVARGDEDQDDPIGPDTPRGPDGERGHVRTTSMLVTDSI